MWSKQFLGGTLIAYLLIIAECRHIAHRVHRHRREHDHNYEVVSTRLLKDGSKLRSIIERETNLPDLPQEDEEIDLDDKRIGLVVGDDKVLVPIDDEGNIVEDFKYLLEPVYQNVRAEDIQDAIVTDEERIVQLLGDSKSGDGRVVYPDQSASGQQVDQSPLVAPQRDNTNSAQNNNEGLQTLERQKEVEEINQIDKASSEKALEEERRENAKQSNQEVAVLDSDSGNKNSIPKLPDAVDYHDSRSDDDKGEKSEKSDKPDSLNSGHSGKSEIDGSDVRWEEGEKPADAVKMPGQGNENPQNVATVNNNSDNSDNKSPSSDSDSTNLELTDDDIKAAASEFIDKLKGGDLEKLGLKEEDFKVKVGDANSEDWTSGGDSDTVKDRKSSLEGRILEQPSPEELKDTAGTKIQDADKKVKILTGGKGKPNSVVAKFEISFTTIIISTTTLALSLIL